MARTVKTRQRSISEGLALRRANGHHSGRRKKRQPLLYDPPELRLLQKERNKPMADWPGEFIGLRYVMSACGNPKDWFKYGHRAQVHQEYNWMWAQAYSERRDMHLTFKHNQILVIGEYGQGKTTLCVHHALHRAFWWGHPVFSNASALFGRRISPEELYTCIVDMPRDGVLFIDEASAAAESGMGGGVAIAALSSSLLNNPKQNVQVLYATAQDHQIANGFNTP